RLSIVSDYRWLGRRSSRPQYRRRACRRSRARAGTSRHCPPYSGRSRNVPVMFQMPPYPLTASYLVSTVVPLVDNRRKEAEMIRGSRFRLLSAGVVALALTATACGGSSSSSSSGGGTTGSGTLSTLVIANAVKIDTLDPAANSVNESIWMDQNLYSRLLQPNATGTGLLPDLATSWTISNKGRTYTFHLRPDAKFANGMPLTASHVVYSIKRSRAYDGGWGFLLTA